MPAQKKLKRVMDHSQITKPILVMGRPMAGQSIKYLSTSTTTSIYCWRQNIDNVTSLLWHCLQVKVKHIDSVMNVYKLPNIEIDAKDIGINLTIHTDTGRPLLIPSKHP